MNKIGGLVGLSIHQSVIEDSYVTGNVSVHGQGAYSIGGLVGDNQSAAINRSYATGDVSSKGYSVGGLDQ